MSYDFIAGCVIASIIVFLFTALWGVEDYSKRLEEKYNKVYCIAQEMKKKITDLAEENDNFIREYEGVIELAGGEDIFDDYYHNSTAFEEVLGEFENDIEDIWEGN